MWDPKATAAVALAAVEDAILFLGSRRLTDELGARAVELLAAERTVDDAPEVLRRIRRLLAHYRATEPALPAWCEAFVTAGYAHYCTLLPTAFVDEDTGVRQVAAMLGFLFTHGGPGAVARLRPRPARARRAAVASGGARPRWRCCGRRSPSSALLPLAELRARCDELLANPLVIPAFPQYMSGFVQALEPAPALAPFVVEVMSKAFAPAARRGAAAVAADADHDAARAGAASWCRCSSARRAARSPAPWRPGRLGAAVVGPARAARRRPGRSPAPAGRWPSCWPRHPAAIDAVAALLGCDGGWQPLGQAVPSGSGRRAHCSRGIPPP